MKVKKLNWTIEEFNIDKIKKVFEENNKDLDLKKYHYY